MEQANQQAIKLSDLFTSNFADSQKCFGVAIDLDMMRQENAYAMSPPANLKEVAFEYKAKPDNSAMDDSLADVIAAWGMSGINITVEMAADQKLPVHSRVDNPYKYLMQIASNSSFVLSLLPPTKDADAVAMAAYVERIEHFTRAYLTTKNFVTAIYPVSNYMEYLFVEAWDQESSSEFKPTDEYVKMAFADAVDKDLEDAIKNRMRAVAFDVVGGEEAFKVMANLMLDRLFKGTIESAEAMNETFVKKAAVAREATEQVNS